MLHPPHLTTWIKLLYREENTPLLWSHSVLLGEAISRLSQVLLIYELKKKKVFKHIWNESVASAQFCFTKATTSISTHWSKLKHTKIRLSFYPLRAAMLRWNMGEACPFPCFLYTLNSHSIKTGSRSPGVCVHQFTKIEQSENWTLIISKLKYTTKFFKEMESDKVLHWLENQKTGANKYTINTSY